MYIFFYFKIVNVYIYILDIFLLYESAHKNLEVCKCSCFSHKVNPTPICVYLLAVGLLLVLVHRLRR